MIVSQETELLDVFEEKFQRFMAMYGKLKSENESLRNTIVERNAREAELQKKLSELQSDYDNLKHTKVLSVSGHDLDSTKKRVSGLVQEVERCIEMLKV